MLHIDQHMQLVADETQSGAANFAVCGCIGDINLKNVLELKPFGIGKVHTVLGSVCPRLVRVPLKH